MQPACPKQPLPGHLQAGFGCKGPTVWQRGAGRVPAAAISGWACLAWILFLLLSEGCGSRADHCCPHQEPCPLLVRCLGLCARKLPTSSPSLWGRAAGLDMTSPNSPGGGGRRGGREGWGKPLSRPGRSVSTVHPAPPGSSEPNCGPGPCRSNSAGYGLALGAPRVRGVGPTLLTHLWKLHLWELSLVRPGGSEWVQGCGQILESYAFSPQTLSSHPA